MDLTQYTIWAPTLMLVLARVMGMFAFAPAFANAALPVKLRYALAVVMSIAVLGRFGQPVQTPQSLVSLIMAIACQAAIGATIGGLARMVIVGIELGAVHISRQVGISLAETFSPALQWESDPLRRLFSLLAVVVFLLIGGHRQMLSGLFGSFSVVPIMGISQVNSLLETAVAVLAAGFVLAIKVAAPVIITLLTVSVVMGLLGRTMPQFGLFSVELPLRAIIGLVVLVAALAGLSSLVGKAVEMMSGHTSTIFQAVV